MLKQKFVIDFVSKFAIQFITASAGIAVARIAGPEVLGVIAFATAYVSIFLFITGLFGSAHIKLVSEGENEKDCLTTYSWLLGISIIIYLIVVLCTFFVQKFVFQKVFSGIGTEYVILIILFSTIIATVFNFSETVFIAKTEQAKSNLPNLIRSIIENILRVLVVFLGFGAIALASVKVLSFLLAFPLIIFLFKGKKFGKFNKEIAKKYWHIALPIFVIVITNSLMMYSDKIILEYFGSTKEIGIYTAAFSIAGMLIILGNTAGTVFFPLFSSLVATNKLDIIKSKVWQFERFLFLIIFPVIISLSLFSYPIMVSLLGIKYEESAPLFSLLIFSSFFAIWGMPYGNIIEGLGLFWLSSLINFLKFLVFITTLLILIHPDIFNLGAMALAITQLTINLFLFIAYYFISFRKIKIQYIKYQLHFLLYGFLVYLLAYYYLVPNLESLSIYFQTFIILPVFTVAIIAFQSFFGLFRKSDVKFFLQLINLKKNIDYVKEEIKGNSHNV